jgi:hypothetical protein
MLKKGARHGGAFLRQHYLDQVHGSDALPRNTLSLRAGTADTGWLPGDEVELRLNHIAGQAKVPFNNP